MTRIEHLLFVLSEECDEVGQRASKAARFSPDEVQPGQELPNHERIYREFADLLAVFEMLHDEAVIKPRAFMPDKRTRELMDAKKAKVGEFLLLSAKCGTLT